MSTESTIDLQYNTYQQLYFQHQTIRREHQGILLESLQNLKHNVNSCLIDDKRRYENAKETFYHKFNIFKRIFTHTASQYKNSSVVPLKQIYQQRKYLSTKVLQLFNETTFETSPIETRTHWNGSIAVVYNPITGRAEWKQYRHGAIHGVFNPITHTIEWEEGFQTGVYGVFNPKLNIVEWKKFYKGGVHGVYNPALDTIEWQTSFHSGIGGVYNPLTKEIEWKTSVYGGVVGYFDYETQTIKWIERWHHGIALISWDSTTNNYITTASCGWYGDN
ncbi:unnamed protein product [Rotaria sp. Silwood1]|nr:unnamed protein product [Rotaria sp. Silwood1]CAF1599946.1 unnamed protein product [Rotaria sp. Silwood1]CAF3697347.1 unnamed protein product [Rotaria sp. Silwood1]CAF4815370.1 unnamed protein product [Rotaria sp. Silwood1]